MDDNINKNPSFPGQEKSSFDEFLKSLNFSFKQASMYFSKHPAFLKSVDRLVESLKALSSYRENVYIGVTPETLVIDGKVFDPRSIACRELAGYLHKRRIKSLELSSKVKRENLSRFIEQIARSLEGLKQGVSVREIVINVEGAGIEEIDYSSLLAEGGKHSKEIWEFLLAKGKRLGGNRDKIEYIAKNIQGVLEEAGRKEIGKKEFGNLFSGVEEVGEELKDTPGAKTFANGLAEGLTGLPAAAAEVLAGPESFTRLKNLLASQVEPEFLEKKILGKITSIKKYNSLMLSFYNLITGQDLGNAEFAGKISAEFGKEADAEKRKKIAERLKEVFFSDESDEFISCLYKKTLAFLPEGEKPDMPEREKRNYREMFNTEAVTESYFYSLLSLFSSEETKEGAELLLAEIGEGIGVFADKEDLKAIADFAGLLEKRKDFLEKNCSREFLAGIYQKVSSQEIADKVKEKMFSEGIEVIVFFARRDEPILDYVLTKFLDVRDVSQHRRLKEILTAVVGDKLVRKIKDLFDRPRSAFLAGEILDLLESVFTKETAELLEKMYGNYRGNILIQEGIINSLRENPYRNRDFIFSLCREKIFELRKPAALSFLTGADKEQTEVLLNTLFHRRNFLGMNDRFFIENIDIVKEAICQEAVPYLLEIILRRCWFFQKRKDLLRIKAFDALTAIDSEKVKEIFPVFINRGCSTVKKQEKLFREKWKI